MWVSPSVSASSSGIRTASVDDCVENDSSAWPQSSPLVCVTTAYDTTSTRLPSCVLARSSCIGCQVAPGIMYVSSSVVAVGAVACTVTSTVVSSSAITRLRSASVRVLASSSGASSSRLRCTSRRAAAVLRSDALMNSTTSA